MQAILFVLVMSKLSSLTEDFLCEIIPADVLAGIRRMIVAVFIGLNHINEQASKVVGVGRSTDLIADNAQGSELSAEIQHRFDEVFAVLSEYPCDTDDEIFIQGFADCELALELCLTVDV